MSRSNNEEVKNPAQRFFEWSGENGNFSYFDKSIISDKNPKGTKVEVKLPFKFIVLDILATVTGWSDADGCGIYANEVKDLATQPLTVRTFKKTDIAHGLYSAIKDKIGNSGGGYTASVYIAYFEGKDLKIGHIKIRGAALTAWIDYGKKFGFYKGAISCDSSVEGKKGKTVFKIPVFKQIPISDETNELAIKLDQELQSYLSKYLGKGSAAVSEPTPIAEKKAIEEEVVNEVEPLNDLPF